ncbi:MAG: LytR C-terminal domain-containing protein [Mycobacteriales bacterium]
MPASPGPASPGPPSSGQPGPDDEPDRYFLDPYPDEGPDSPSGEHDVEDEVDTASTEHPRARAERLAGDAEPPSGGALDGPDGADAGAEPAGEPEDPPRFFFDDLAAVGDERDGDGEGLARYAGVGAAARAGGEHLGDAVPVARERDRDRERGQKVVGALLLALVAAAVLVVVGARIGGSGSKRATTGGGAAVTSSAKSAAAKSTAVKSTPAKSTEARSTAPVTTRPSTTTKPTTAKPTTTKPTTAKPTTVKPTTAKPTTAKPTTAKPTTAKPTTAKPAVVPTATKAPLTVLNNTTTTGLAGQAAQIFTGKGWHVNQVSNYTGDLPTTTVFYDQGNDAQQKAARSLAAQFPAITSVQPRIGGLPGSGLTVVLAPNWG